MAGGLQRIDIKLLIETTDDINLDPFLVIFNRWRQQKDHPADWVDLADYAHMRSGPGILIAGKRDTFAIDLNPPGPGLLTSTRAGLSGDLTERFRTAKRRAQEFNEAVLSEPEFPASMNPQGAEWVVFLNDRLNFPNNDETDEKVRPALAAALEISPDSLVRSGNELSRLSFLVNLTDNA